MDHHNHETKAEMIQNRIIIFIFYVLSIMAALAWNDYFRDLIVERKISDEEKKLLFFYALIITGILIIFIVFIALIFGYVPGV